MNYKLKIHFLNDVTIWRAHVPALITMDIIKSPFLHQCRLHSNGNGFKIVQKSFIKSSSNLQEANHLGFTCQQNVDQLLNSLFTQGFSGIFFLFFVFAFKFFCDYSLILWNKVHIFFLILIRPWLQDEFLM